MKCKAKWIARWKWWQLYCPQCDSYTVTSINRLPQDMAEVHAGIYHKE